MGDADAADARQHRHGDLCLLAWFSWRERLGRIGFYVLFALVVTISVQLVGVYLVFTSLIVPAVATYRYPPRRQLPSAMHWRSSVTWWDWCCRRVLDLPSSPVIVWAMAAAGVVVLLGQPAQARD